MTFQMIHKLKTSNFIVIIERYVNLSSKRILKPSTTQRLRCLHRRWTCRTPCWTSCGSHPHCCRASCRLQRRRDTPPSRSASDDGILPGAGSGTKWNWHGSGKCKSIFLPKRRIFKGFREGIVVLRRKISILIKVSKRTTSKVYKRMVIFKIINRKTPTVSKWIEPR